MKKLLNLLSFIIFISIIIFFQSCNEENPVEPEPETIIADNTVQVDSNDFKSNLVSLDSAEIVYSNSNSFTQSLVVGGFIVSDYSQGVLRKIESIQTQGNQIIVGTRQARLDEVILVGKIYFNEEVDPQQFKLEATSDPNVKIYKTTETITVTFQGVKFGGNSDMSLESGTTFKNPRFVLDIEFNFGITKFECYLQVTNESYIELNTTGNVVAGGSYIPPFARFVLPPIPSPIGIPVVPIIQFGVGGDINIPLASHSRFDAEIVMKMGFGLLNSLPYFIADVNPTTTANSDLELEGAYFRNYLIFPKVGLYVVGLLGPYFEQQVSAKGTVASDNLGAYLSFGFGVTGKGGVEFDLFGLLQAGVSFDIYDQEWEILKNYITGGGGGVPCPGIPIVNYESKTYNTVLIGEQCWLKENLDVGTRINGIQEQTNNQIIEKYCYNDDPVNCNTYGGLYQWNETMKYVTNERAQGICPPGWHIPTLTEFETLIATVNYDGNALKAIGQGTGGGVGTNTSGFSLLLAGFLNDQDEFRHIKNVTHLWASTEDYGESAIHLGVAGNSNLLQLTNPLYKVDGLSVRCLKD